MEFTMKCSVALLYEFVTKAEYLGQWFADSCDSKGDDYVFVWDGYSQFAEIIDNADNEFVRYYFKDMPDDEYFEFRIDSTEISGDTIFRVIDFADPAEIKDAQKLWESQVRTLRHVLGTS